MMMAIFLTTVFAATPGDTQKTSASTAKEAPPSVVSPAQPDPFEAEFARLNAANKEHIQQTKKWREKQGEQRNNLDDFMLEQNALIANEEEAARREILRELIKQNEESNRLSKIKIRNNEIFNEIIPIDDQFQISYDKLRTPRSTGPLTLKENSLPRGPFKIVIRDRHGRFFSAYTSTSRNPDELFFFKTNYMTSDFTLLPAADQAKYENSPKHGTLQIGHDSYDILTIEPLPFDGLDNKEATAAAAQSSPSALEPK